MMPILLKAIMMIVGVFLVALGVVITPLPGPFGVPVILFGLVILLRSSTWIKRQFVKQVKKHPRTLKPVRALLRPGAKIVALIWLRILRLERRILPHDRRFLHRFRRRLATFLSHRKHARRVFA